MFTTIIKFINKKFSFQTSSVSAIIIIFINAQNGELYI